MERPITEILPDLHRLQLMLAVEVKRLCQKHNIKYFVIAGTLLGAVRHKGFIPWDDDMDIGMLREDYERFVAIAQNELDVRMSLQSFNTDQYYAMPFCKLILKDTCLVERSSAKNKALKGVFIDIFPFDSAPDDETEYQKHNRKTYVLKRLLLARQGYKVYDKGDLKKRLVYGGLKLVSYAFTKKKLWDMLDSTIRKYNTLNTKRVVTVGGSYGYVKETIERKWLDDTVELDFEDTKLAVPADYISYLEYFYGDYMTPPPEDKRFNRHELVELDFGPYTFDN